MPFAGPSDADNHAKQRFENPSTRASPSGIKARQKTAAVEHTFEISKPKAERLKDEILRSESAISGL